MKCEKCNEREANFFYTATINGETTQRHLCSECAAEEGLDKLLRQRDEVFSDFFGRRSLFDSFFADPFALMDGFFPRRSLFGSLLPGMMTLPRQRVAPEQEQPKAEAAAAETEAPAGQEAQEVAEKAIPQDAGEEIRMLRELNALKHQLHEAVYAENFEKAIELRDKIRELEK